MAAAFLYVIRRPTDGARKVGQSVNPASRLIGLNSEQGCRCALEHSAPCPADDVDAAEKHAHALLWDLGLGREWFDADLETARRAVDAAVAAALAGEPMRRPPKAGKFIRLEMRVDPEWLKRLDEWRRKQEDIPTRAEAVRRMTEQVLAQAG